MSNPTESAPEVVKTAMKRFEMAATAEETARREALEDLKFLSGEQWPDAIKKQRESEGRPCLTINRIRPSVKQVTNEQRQNRPGIEVSPVGDGADEDTAEIIQGIVRHIEDDSDADVAYDTAGFHAAATGGPGWIRVDPEYEDPDNEEGPQVIKINRVRNAFIVYDDPSAQKADRSDSQWRFFIEDLTKEEYKQLYPKSELASLDDWASIGDTTQKWLSDDHVRIAEYFYFDKKDGTRQLKWCKFNAVEVLDETEVNCRWIPSVPVFGDEVEIDGKLEFSGIVRDAKDPQRMYNFWASKETEAIALAPTSPWVGWAGQFQGQEAKWGTANTKNWAYLEVNPTVVGGVPAPSLPQRQAIEPAVAAITQARVAASQDLEATTGVYPAQLGAPSDEKTGKAILARQQQGHVANFDLSDNLRRAIKHLGRILISMIPHIYSEPRVLQIIREDGTAESVQINKKFKDGAGVEKIYDVTTGKYAVTVSAGPSYQTRRKEAAESMMALTSAQPALLNICGDLMVKSMDWPYANEVADRLKKMLPPQLQENDGTPEAQLQQAQAQLQALGAQHQALTQVVQKQNEIINQKLIEAQSKKDAALIDSQTKISLEKMKIEAQVTMAEVNTKAQALNERAAFIEDLWKQLHGQAHELAMQKDDQAHQMGMAQQSAENAQTQQLTQIGADQQAQEQANAAGNQ